MPLIHIYIYCRITLLSNKECKISHVKPPHYTIYISKYIAIFCCKKHWNNMEVSFPVKQLAYQHSNIVTGLYTIKLGCNVHCLWAWKTWFKKNIFADAKIGIAVAWPSTEKTKLQISLTSSQGFNASRTDSVTRKITGLSSLVLSQLTGTCDTLRGAAVKIPFSTKFDHRQAKCSIERST